MNASPSPRRSLVVSWLLGAAAVVLVTFSFEALSSREAAPGRCPVTGAVATGGAMAPPACPAMDGIARCPVTGAKAAPEGPPRHCPAGGDSADPTRKLSVI